MVITNCIFKSSHSIHADMEDDDENRWNYGKIGYSATWLSYPDLDTDIGRYVFRGLKRHIEGTTQYYLNIILLVVTGRYHLVQ